MRVALVMVSVHSSKTLTKTSGMLPTLPNMLKRKTKKEKGKKKQNPEGLSHTIIPDSTGRREQAERHHVFLFLTVGVPAPMP